MAGRQHSLHLAIENETYRSFSRSIMYQQCNKCLFDTQIGTISFNKDGVCNYCEMVAQFSIEYGTGKQKGKTTLATILDDIKRAGKKKKHRHVTKSFVSYRNPFRSKNDHR